MDKTAGPFDSGVHLKWAVQGTEVITKDRK